MAAVGRCSKIGGCGPLSLLWSVASSYAVGCSAPWVPHFVVNLCFAVACRAMPCYNMGGSFLGMYAVSCHACYATPWVPSVS